MLNYDPGAVVCSVAGNLMSGFAPDTFVSFKLETPVFSDMVGADGEVVRVKSRDRRATIQITLLQSSGSNDILSALAALDQSDGLGVGTFLLHDNNGSTHITSSDCWVSELPEVTFGKEAGNRQWTLRLADAQIEIGGASDL